jgi:hypothetical protein
VIRGGRGGEGAAVDEGGASGELGAAGAGEQGCVGEVDAGVDERGGDAFAEVLHLVGGLGADAGAGVEQMDVVDITDRRSSDTGSELRRFTDYMSVTVSWGRRRSSSEWSHGAARPPGRWTGRERVWRGKITLLVRG